MKREDHEAKLRLGRRVIVALAALTLVEFWVAVGVRSSLPWLTVTTLTKAWLVLRWFMHVREVWSKK